MDRLVVDCSTGEEVRVPLTAEEVVERDAQAVEKAQEASVRQTQETNARTIREAADAALTANQAFLALVSVTNIENAAQIKRLTRQQNGVIRLLLGRLDATT